MRQQLIEKMQTYAPSSKESLQAPPPQKRLEKTQTAVKLRREMSEMVPGAGRRRRGSDNLESVMSETESEALEGSVHSPDRSKRAKDKEIGRRKTKVRINEQTD